jgi:hypothetical protein
LLTLSLMIAGSTNSPTGCTAGEFVSLVNNGLNTRLSSGSSTIYTGEWATFTATVTDERPSQPFEADQYDWYVDGALVSTTTVNQVQVAFEDAGRHLVEVTVAGRRTSTSPAPNGGVVTSDHGDVSDSAALYVNVQAAPTGGSAGDPNDGATASVSISGPDELAAGASGTYTASASGASVTITWDLLGDSATLGSTSGSTTTVTGASGGYVTLVAEARDADLGNVLASAQKSIDIIPEYVVWYTGNVDCWDAPRVYVSTREDFNAWRSTASIPGGGTDTSEELIKVEMQGGFESRDDAMAWICSQFSSRRSHAWCGRHYNIGGTYYTDGNLTCDFDSLPSEN